MIFVVGATGLVGRQVCRRLAAAGQQVRALVRPTSDASKIEELKQSGATLVRGDLKDRASLDAACRGVSAVITTASTTFSRQPDDSIQGVEQDGQRRLVDAAVRAGARRFVYVSFSHHIEVDCPLTTAKRTVERHLTQSGLDYTILAPSFYMEVWLGPALGFDMKSGKAQIFGSGKNAISWISLGDVARFAAVAIEHPKAKNATIELGGPEALAPLDVVRTCEELCGRSFDGLVPADVHRADARIRSGRPHRYALDPRDVPGAVDLRTGLCAAGVTGLMPTSARATASRGGGQARGEMVSGAAPHAAARRSTRARAPRATDGRARRTGVR